MGKYKETWVVQKDSVAQNIFFFKKEEKKPFKSNNSTGAGGGVNMLAIKSFWHNLEFLGLVNYFRNVDTILKDSQEQESSTFKILLPPPSAYPRPDLNIPIACNHRQS